MSLALWLAFFYVLGGLTLVPMMALSVVVFLYWTLPQVPSDQNPSLVYDKIAKSKPSFSDESSPKKKVSRPNSVSSISSDTLSSSGSQNNNNSISPAIHDTNHPAVLRHSSTSLSLDREHETGVDAYFAGILVVSRNYFIYPTGGPNNTGNPPPPASNQAAMNQNESAYSTLYKLISKSKSSVTVSSMETTSSSSISHSSSFSEGSSETGKLTTSSTFSSITSSSTSSSTQSKKSKLIKYHAILRHGNLFLYEDPDHEQLTQVIVIAHHLVTLWPPKVPDGELFAKRSAICLVKIPYNHGSSNLSDYEIAEMLSNPKEPPKNAFYLYSDNASEKEDFYFALIRASKRYTLRSAAEPTKPVSLFNPVYMAHPLHHRTSDIMDLIQTLHSTDSNIQTRWLNAIIGRIFLATKDTPPFTNFLINKISNKLTRIKRPTFLSEIYVTQLSCGDSIPYITHPKLSELTPEGKLTIDCDVSYSGNFSLQITTKATLNLGSRIKPREVTIALAITLKHLEGKLILKIKPPPSDRIWYTFEVMPKISLLIEPVVSSRQIKYSIVTKAIENKFRESFRESLVYPNFEDISFFNTSSEVYRGGIWDSTVRPNFPEPSDEVYDSDDDTAEDSNNTVTNSEALVSSSVDPPTGNLKQLRHRKTTPNLRVESPNGAEKATLEHRRPLSRSSTRSMDSLIGQSSSSPNNNDDIEDKSHLKSRSAPMREDSDSSLFNGNTLRQENDVPLEGRRKPRSVSPTPSKASSVRSGTIMNAVKKWWPIKETHSVENNGPLDRLAQSQDGEDMKRDLSQESLRQKVKTAASEYKATFRNSRTARFGSFSGESKDDDASYFKRRPSPGPSNLVTSTSMSNIKPAPLPHNFPPELMSMLGKDDGEIEKKQERRLKRGKSVDRGGDRSTIVSDKKPTDSATVSAADIATTTGITSSVTSFISTTPSQELSESQGQEVFKEDGSSDDAIKQVVKPTRIARKPVKTESTVSFPEESKKKVISAESTKTETETETETENGEEIDHNPSVQMLRKTSYTTAVTSPVIVTGDSISPAVPIARKKKRSDSSNSNYGGSGVGSLSSSSGSNTDAISFMNKQHNNGGTSVSTGSSPLHSAVTSATTSPVLRTTQEPRSRRSSSNTNYDGMASFKLSSGGSGTSLSSRANATSSGGGNKGTDEGFSLPSVSSFKRHPATIVVNIPSPRSFPKIPEGPISEMLTLSENSGTSHQYHKKPHIKEDEDYPGNTTVDRANSVSSNSSNSNSNSNTLSATTASTISSAASFIARGFSVRRKAVKPVEPSDSSTIKVDEEVEQEQSSLEPEFALKSTTGAPAEPRLLLPKNQSETGHVGHDGGLHKGGFVSDFGGSLSENHKDEISQSTVSTLPIPTPSSKVNSSINNVTGSLKKATPPSSPRYRRRSSGGGRTPASPIAENNSLGSNDGSISGSTIGGGSKSPSFYSHQTQQTQQKQKTQHCNAPDMKTPLLAKSPSPLLPKNEVSHHHNASPASVSAATAAALAATNVSTIMTGGSNIPHIAAPPIALRSKTLSKRVSNERLRYGVPGNSSKAGVRVISEESGGVCDSGEWDRTSHISGYEDDATTAAALATASAALVSPANALTTDGSGFGEMIAKPVPVPTTFTHDMTLDEFLSAKGPPTYHSHSHTLGKSTSSHFRSSGSSFNGNNGQDSGSSSGGDGVGYGVAVFGSPELGPDPATGLTAGSSAKTNCVDANGLTSSSNTNRIASGDGGLITTAPQAIAIPYPGQPLSTGTFMGRPQNGLRGGSGSSSGSGSGDINGETSSEGRDNSEFSFL
ncbi:uncharacterized protein SAPINGB_P003041 [Magnusiomyces paraingens]|uniref:SMP-LTD domain-containing protein n=1 Tax=Magnusiomyces paraingens TaxID=2606893 RepID=A0A5E8BJ79_9ASCO|nr:uncharacterized protein SAPINGB_P003041 [Saprochaete ingens]VVT51271.1 unnamed protein product [Saprochaete ingens]